MVTRDDYNYDLYISGVSPTSDKLFLGTIVLTDLKWNICTHAFRVSFHIYKGNFCNCFSCYPPCSSTIKHYSLHVFLQGRQWPYSRFSYPCSLATMPRTNSWRTIFLHFWLHVKSSAKSSQMCIICWRNCMENRQSPTKRKIEATIMIFCTWIRHRHS